jgi:hypothetical protein
VNYHYGSINVTRTIRHSNSAGCVGGGELRYAVNGISFAEADTPLKLVDYYNISGVFRLGGIPDAPPVAADGAEAVRRRRLSWTRTTGPSSRSCSRTASRAGTSTVTACSYANAFVGIELKARTRVTVVYDL